MREYPISMEERYQLVSKWQRRYKVKRAIELIGLWTVLLFICTMFWIGVAACWIAFRLW